MDLSLITYHLILPMLKYFQHLFGSYGWAIIAVTVLIKLVLYPLTYKQTESMKKMQALQPKIKIIQDRFNLQKERYKDRPAKLKELQDQFQKDMMEFYQSNQVNPLGGCLPTVVQLPILIALFWAFNGAPFKEVSVSVPIDVLVKNETTSEYKQGTSKPQIYIDEKGEKARYVLIPGSARIIENTELNYKVEKVEGNISNADKKIKWLITDSPYFNPGYKNMINVDEIAELSVNNENSILLKAKKSGKIYLHAIFPAASENENFLFIQGLGKTGVLDKEKKHLNVDVLILVILFAFTIWLSGKVTSMFSPPPSDPKQAEMQKSMQQLMPPMIGIMMLLFPVPSGVLLYFVASGLIQAAQTWLVMRTPIKNLNPEILSENKKVKTNA